MTCFDCGSDAEVFRSTIQRSYVIEMRKGVFVTLFGIEVIACRNCGLSPIIPNANGLLAIALQLDFEHSAVWVSSKKEWRVLPE